MRHLYCLLVVLAFAACGGQLTVESVTPRVVHRNEVITVRFSEARSYYSVYLDDTKLQEARLSTSAQAFAFRVPSALQTGEHILRIKAGDNSWEKGFRVEDRAAPPRFKSIATLDRYRTCALETNGDLWCWGRNIPDGWDLVADTPVRVDVNSTSFKSIVVSEAWVYALSSTGELFTAVGSQKPTFEGCCFDDLFPVNWNLNISAAAMSPNGAMDINDHSAVLANVPRGYRSVALAEDFACAIDIERQIVCWGQNLNGELGTGVTQSTEQPTAIAEPGPWKEVVAGMYYTYGFGCGLKDSGEIWCWGTKPYATRDHQSGKTIVHYSIAPYPINEVRENDQTIVAPAFDTMYSSQGNACAISKGKVFAWGLREKPILLTPDQFVEKPTRVDVEGDWRFVACSLEGQICAINVKGDIGCWQYLEGEDFSPVMFVKAP